MSPSKEYRSQECNPDHSSRPSFHNDPAEQSGHEGAKERTGEKADISLVEQILEFLDKYPSCFEQQTTMAGYLRSC